MDYTFLARVIDFNKRPGYSIDAMVLPPTSRFPSCEEGEDIKGEFEEQQKSKQE